MEKFLEFFAEHAGIFSPVIAMIIGILIPTDLFKVLGVKVRTRGNIPPYILEIVAERLDAFEKGLLGEDFKGNKNIIGNSQLSKNVGLLKKDLTNIKIDLKE